ncbi:MAG: metalloregulator ArsR/SmtB family transcription factor [Candidatus Altiarchaeota archaeon]
MNELSYKLFFKAFSNTTRFTIIHLLRNKPMNVSEICEKTGFEQSRISHNLRYLHAWGFVNCEKDGRNRIYRLDGKYLLPIIDHMEKYMEEYEEKLKTCGILHAKKICKHLEDEW